MPRSAFVTGATGFVGSHLVDLLVDRGWRVVALVRPTSDTGHLERAGATLRVGALSAETLRGPIAGHDVVFHLAAATRAASEAAYERVNVEGTRAVMDAAASAAAPPGRVVYLGSMAAAGPSLGGEPVAETDAPHPITAYGRTKLAAERISLARDDVRTVALRPPAVYGPRDRDLLPFFRMARLGVMAVPAGPPRELQLIHVHDLARALLAAAEAPGARGVYHVAEARAYRWGDVVELIGAAVGRRPRSIPIPRTLVRAAAALSEAGSRMVGRPTIFNRDKARELLAAGWLCTTERAQRELGFVARIPLEQGIRRTAEWYRGKGWLS